MNIICMLCRFIIVLFTPCFSGAFLACCSLLFTAISTVFLILHAVSQHFAKIFKFVMIYTLLYLLFLAFLQPSSHTIPLDFTLIDRLPTATIPIAPDLPSQHVTLRLVFTLPNTPINQGVGLLQATTTIQPAKIEIAKLCLLSHRSTVYYTILGLVYFVPNLLGYAETTKMYCTLSSQMENPFLASVQEMQIQLSTASFQYYASELRIEPHLSPSSLTYYFLHYPLALYATGIILVISTVILRSRPRGVRRARAIEYRY